MPSQKTIREHLSRLASSKLGTRIWGIGWILVLTAALGMTFGAFFLTAFRVTIRAREVSVPDVRGLGVAEATQALSDIGLVLAVDQRRPDPEVPLDHVLAQDPEPGSVLRRQRAVRVRISDGQRDPELPSVVGEAERTAEIVLAQAQVDIAGRAEIRTTSYPAGTVVAQDPPDQQRAGAVSLLVNRGQTGMTFVMPDVIGTVSGRVVDILRRRGFRVSVTAEAPYPGLPPGIVVRQTPQAGFQVAIGDPILLEVSR